jgi:hypothetical protein
MAADPAPPRATPRPVDYVCNTCGGNSVTRDAWAAWDAEAQEWTLGAAFDYANCHDCEGETKLVEVDRDTRDPTGG